MVWYGYCDCNAIMRVYHFQKFLVRVRILILCTGILSLTGYGPLWATPAPAESRSAGPNQSPAGVASAGDDILSTDNMLEQARNAAEGFDFIIAEALYQTILLRDGKNLPAILELADVYEKTGKLEYARGLLLRASVLRPHDEKIIAKSREISDLLLTVLIEEVDTLIARRQCDLALPKLSMLLTIEPENPDLYFKKAICHQELGKPKTALVYIDDALRLQKNAEYFNLHAKITKSIKQKELNGLISTAQSLMKEGTPSSQEKALEVLGEILRIDPEHAWARECFVILSDGKTPSRKMIHTAGALTIKPGEPGDGAAGGSSSVGEIWSAVQDQRTLILLLAAISVFILAILAFTKFKNKPTIQPLAGRFSHFSLREIISFLKSTNRTGVLRIESKFTNGELYFKKGEICHCKSGKLTGSEACSLLLNKIRAGSFEFLDCSPRIENTIEIPHSLLSLEPQTDLPALDSRPDVPALGFNGTPASGKHESAPAKTRRPKSRMKELLEKKR